MTWRSNYLSTDHNLRLSFGTLGISVISEVNLQIVESDSLLAHFVHYSRSTHLSQVEWLASDVVMQDVRDTKVEAEDLQRIEYPMINHLILEEHILLRNITIVVHTSRDNLQRCLSKHIGEEKQDTHIGAESVDTRRYQRGEEQYCQAKMRRQYHW